MVLVAIVVEVAVVTVEVVVLDGKQVPLMLGFCCLQSFTKLRQVFRCAAFIFRQAFFSAFVPVQSLFFGTSARQFLMSCLQSLRQWLGFAVTPPLASATPRTPPNARRAIATRPHVPRTRLTEPCIIVLLLVGYCRGDLDAAIWCSLISNKPWIGPSSVPHLEARE